MNITCQIPAKTANEVDSAPRKIGIHIDLPPTSFWQPLGCERRLLQRQICNALRSVGLLHQTDNEASWFLAFEMRVVGVVAVLPFGPAMNTVMDELAAVGLLERAQLAWADMDQQIWHPERPNPAPVPFSKHIDDVLATLEKLKTRANMTPEARQAAIVDCLGQMKALLSKKAVLPTTQLPPHLGEA